MVLKLNKGIKKDLSIVVANHLSSIKSVKVNQLKKEIMTFLEPLKTLNKKGRGSIMRLVEKDHRETVDKAINEFVIVMEQKPKRMLSQYMKFSCEKSVDERFSKFTFRERGRLIADEWNSLTEQQKKKYRPSKKERDDYTKSNVNFKKSLTNLKLQKL